MATPDQIPSDLTLEIGADVGPEQFLALTRAFFGYVHEVASMVSPQGGEPHWKVQVREGSALIAMDPLPSAPAEIVRVVYAKARSGAQALADGDIEAAGLTEGALKHLRAMSEVAEGSKGLPTPVRIWVERKPVQVNAEIARVIREDWRAAYSDFGTVEGRLRTIQEAGRLQLLLRDDMMGQTVKCYFPEEMLADAFASFRRRVEVTGLIHYRRNGTPISIEAAKIEPLPDDNDLPSPEAVRGILRVVG